MTSQAPSIKPYCNQEALDKFFWELEAKLPNPPAGWEKAAKPCKYKKLLQEQHDNACSQRPTNSCMGTS